MLTPETVKQWITEGMECTHLRVAGDGQHFEALIVSTAFEGLSKIKRHQAVYKALGTHMHTDIHALSMRTLTPTEHNSTQ